MNRIGPGGSHLASLLAVACALAATGCLPAGGEPRTAAGRDAAAVRLVPDPAYATARIAVVFGQSALDPATCRFEWRRNGALIDGATTSALEPSRFSRGDRISVRVSVPAAADASVEPLAAEVRVANSPPHLTRVGIVRETAEASELRAWVECVDPDGDATNFEYAWFRNGARVESASGASLPAGSCARGDRVTVTVIARDDERESLPASGDPFVFENHAPAFTSRPLAPRPGDAVFQYRAVAVDPDGDPLRYELTGAPAGMTVDARGDLRWELPAGERRRGEHPVRLRATDSQGGEAVQEFTIRL